jgi:L-iditol 2-dehydrogenase
MAKKLGATQTYLVEKGKDNETYAREVVALFDGERQPDITIECSGAESSTAMGIYATRSGLSDAKIKTNLIV